MAEEETLEEIKAKYERRIRKSFKEKEPGKPQATAPYSPEAQPLTSREYKAFKKERMPHHLSFYEKFCNWSEKILRAEPEKKKIPELKEAIRICHLEVTPTGVMSASLLAPFLFALSIIFIAFIIPSLIMPGSGNMFFVLFAILAGLGIVIPIQKLPFFLANNWRMKASNQMVLCIFYIVTYMRHTSNLERALSFAAEHLAPPLAFDLKKVLWDVESETFDTLKESLDDYLRTWRKYNMEFIESIHLIESSLYESTEGRRLDALDKSLSVILEETYEKMLHYAHNLKGPLTALHMLGIILPILGLVILPLLVSFMPEVKWYHLFMLYNVVLPVVVFYLARNILSTRPTGYGESDISETNKALRKYRNILIPIGKEELRISPSVVAIIIFIILFIIGSLPLIMHAVNPDQDLAVLKEGGLQVINEPTHLDATFYFLGYREEVVSGGPTGKLVGPFGLGATILSLFMVLAFGIGIGIYYHFRSKNVIKIREQAKALEKEFASALFQLGNRLGDGLPAEIAFGKVAQVMEGTLSGRFFELVSINISKLGMNVEQAIFDRKRGALVYYPSNLIESSMKVLVESSKKGPLIASQAVINISEYIKQMHRVDERLNDLMADIVSSMKSQISFLTPAIAGIVVGITSMITQILGNLSLMLSALGSEAGGAGGDIGGMGGVLGMFGTGIPTYYFQIIVGLYVVQITFILSVLINGIENGSDKLSERYIIGNNLLKTTVTYVIVALCVTILFTLIAGSILTSVISTS
ncbi:hypothetical protein AYK26_01660 [Euryarchaeota archaeon SM23-78]|nr:MAG: hypothetical protein AYK26_01660 [Euryarchaeota archaeon SM23-78]MBW3000485.1 hypothetical protein [Candidatus Woesearchaeota archaeon]